MSSTPANLIQLQGAAKSFGSRFLFQDATFSINEGEHVGVIGPNGAGKTTLFKLLAGEIEVDEGEVIKSRNLSMGYLRQHDVWDESKTLDEYLSDHTKMPIWELKQLAVDLGLKETQFDQPIKSLSGGYKMRAKLLHLLGEQPNLMLLDEPTNYLDLETLLVLERFLQSFEGAFLLISHDREFLRRTTDHILEIEAGDFVKYSGNIDDYFEQKQMLREQLEKQVMTEQAKKKQVLDFAARFGAKASKARQVQSRLKQLEKRESIELKSLPVAAKIRIPEPTHTGRMCLELKDADLGYGEKTILSHVDITIETGDRIGVVGYNGAGKSTLLKTLAKELPLLHGEIGYGYQVQAAYYAQHVAERLDPKDTVLGSLSKVAHPSVKQQEISDLAGSLLFSGDNAKKSISVLSGGEKARVALGQILLKRYPFLLMDEPTNHLDFYTVESLTQALETYKGTVIFVSHDRGFVRRAANKILEVRSGQARLYRGTYDEYVWSVENNPVSEEEKALKPRPRNTTASTAVVASTLEVSEPAKVAPAFDREKVKALETEKRGLEKVMTDLDKKIKIIESRMQEQSIELASVQGTRAADLARELSMAQKKLQELESIFMLEMEKKEGLQKQIEDLKAGH